MLSVSKMNEVLRELKPKELQNIEVRQIIGDLAGVSRYVLEIGKSRVWFEWLEEYVLIEALNMGERKYRIDEFVLGMELLHEMLSSVVSDIVLLVGPGTNYREKLSADWHEIEIESPNVAPSIFPEFRFRGFYPRYQVFSKSKLVVSAIMERESIIKEIELHAWCFDETWDKKSLRFMIGSKGGICFDVVLQSTFGKVLEVIISQGTFEFKKQIKVNESELVNALLMECDRAGKELELDKLINNELDMFTLMARINKTLEREGEMRLNGYYAMDELMKLVIKNIDLNEFNLYEDIIRYSKLPIIESVGVAVDALTFGGVAMVFTMIQTPYTYIKAYDGEIDLKDLEKVLGDFHSKQSMKINT